MDTDRCKHGMTHLRSDPTIFILSFLSYCHYLDHDNTELTLKQLSDNMRKECYHILVFNEIDNRCCWV